jgi:hypothetical protein
MSVNPNIHRDAFNLLCDELIYQGMSRAVWSSEVLADCVVKVEDLHVPNVIEWETWQRVKDTAMAKWFAPCRWISANGTILVMERTGAAGDAQYPERCRLSYDFKRRNYGMLGDRLVCHDYGTNMLFEHGMTKRQINANWTDAA